MSHTWRMIAAISVVALLAGCVMPGTGLSPAPSATPGPFQLTVVHSNDTWGYLFPCG